MSVEWVGRGLIRFAYIFHKCKIASPTRRGIVEYTRYYIPRPVIPAVSGTARDLSTKRNFQQDESQSRESLQWDFPYTRREFMLYHGK